MQIENNNYNINPTNQNFNNDNSQMPKMPSIRGKMVQNANGSWQFEPDNNIAQPISNTYLTEQQSKPIQQSSISPIAQMPAKKQKPDRKVLKSVKKPYHNFIVQLYVYLACFIVLVVSIIAIFSFIALIKGSYYGALKPDFANIALSNPLSLQKDSLNASGSVKVWLNGLVIADWFSIIWSFCLFCFNISIIKTIVNLKDKKLIGSFNMLFGIVFSFILNIIFIAIELTILYKKINKLALKSINPN